MIRSVLLASTAVFVLAGSSFVYRSGLSMSIGWLHVLLAIAGLLFITRSG